MRGDLRFEQRRRLRATCFSQVVKRKSRPLPRMHRRIALHIRQRKSRFAVTTVGRPEQREKSGVLAERQELPVTKRPAFWRKIERKDSDFSDKWIHFPSLGL